MTPAIHRSVMPAEIVRWLGEIEPRVVVDGTYGGGGHTRRMLDLFPPQQGRLVADRSGPPRGRRGKAALPRRKQEIGWKRIPMTAEDRRH